MAEFDAKKQMEVMYKVIKAQEDSVKALERKVDAATGSPDVIMAKVEILQRMFTAFKQEADVGRQALERLGQNIGLKEDLSKSDVKFKLVMARLEALSAQVEASAKDRVSRADLLALEKKLTEAMKKAK